MAGSAAPILVVLAQLSAAGAPAEAPTIARPNAAAAETLKERLSDKASDEQRVDNCRVPIGQRGTKPRPDCGDSDPSATSRAGDPGHLPPR